MKKIYYIGYYDTLENGMRLLTQPSTNSKMNYIKDAIIKAGYQLDIISIAHGKSNNVEWFHKEKHEDYNIIFLTSIGRGNIFTKSISIILIVLQLINIILRAKKDDVVLLYHSIPISFIILRICRIFKKRFFLEIEEIYSVLRHFQPKQINKELKLLDQADGYIAVNDYISSLCKKPYCVCYGSYTSRSIQKTIVTSSTIKILYSGVLGPDSDLAIEVCKGLPNNYELHILGYGDEKTISSTIINVEKAVQEGYNIFYHGCMIGKEYETFITQCHIGLCSRVADSEESRYAFPSKILVYFSNNLITVTTPLASITDSKLSRYMYLSKGFSAADLAESILEATSKDRIISNRHILVELEDKFIEELKFVFG